ncbi:MULTISPECIES: ZIP family metal transporter [unclassified Adlercreutzia]|uniref:ZIP family metal transporter n=1 Tax=unclassified Adlercreutzia TaxID=2636013 RepID=UPI001F155BDB|nr:MULTISPECIES: ZIP family metal transporter [unclassified Adlercreutzia]
MEMMDPFWFVTLVTLLSGAGGTGVGGVVGALCKSDSNRTISLLLAFAGGVMTAMVCFDLLAESVEAAGEVLDPGVLLVIASVVAGVGVVYGLNYVIDRRTHDEVPHVASAEHPKTHDDIDELIHADHWAEHKRNNDSRASLMVAGVVMACAIALHNVPEGMTIGASFAISDNLMLGTGMVMAVLIGLHNIPEGMAVSVPLISGGMGRARAVALTAACGLPTLLGAWLGLWLGDVGPFGLAASLGFASGAMLYVVFGEIIPQSVLMYRSKAPAFAVIVGLMLGLLIIFA